MTSPYCPLLLYAKVDHSCNIKCFLMKQCKICNTETAQKKLFCPPPSPPLTTPKKFTPNFFEKIFPTENEKKNLSPAYFKMFESFFLKKNNRKLINCFMLFLFFLREKFIMRYTLVNSFPHLSLMFICMFVCLFVFCSSSYFCFEHKKLNVN